MEDKKKQSLERAYEDVDGGYSWVVLVANTVAFCIATGFLLTTGIVHTTLEERFHGGAAKTSLAGSAFDSMCFLTGPIGAMLTDKTSCRVSMVTGSLLMTIGFVVSAFSNSLDLCIVFSGFLAGLGGGIMHPSLFVVIGFNFKEKYSIAQGTVVASGGLGLFAMAPLLEFINKSYGFFSFFLVMAALSLQLMACGMFLRPSKRELDAKRERQLMSKRGERNIQLIKQNVQLYAKLLLNKTVLCLSLSFLTMNGAMYTIFILWPTFLSAKGFTTMQTSLVLSTAGIASVFGRFIIGVIASFQRDREVTLYSSAYVILAIPFVCFHFYSYAFVGHLIVAVMVGLFSGASFVLISSINTKYVGLEFASASIGIEFFFGGLGAMSVPTLSGVLVTQGWTPEHVFLMSGVLLLLTGFLCFIIRFNPVLSREQVLELEIPMKEQNEQQSQLIMLQNGT